MASLRVPLLRPTAERRRRRAVHQLFRSAQGKDTPETRGWRLLRCWLSRRQRMQFDARGYFDVIGCDSGTKYRIRCGVSANIEEFGSDGNPIARWCFIPVGELVPGDVMLAQKIALETNERATLMVANRFPLIFPAIRRETLRAFGRSFING